MMEFLEKFNKVVSQYKLTNNELYDIATALCLADKVWGTNDKKLDINRLLVSINVFDKKPTKSYERLPKVQVKRVLNDTLIIAIKGKGIKLPEGAKLSSQAATKVEAGIVYLDYYDEVKAEEIIELFQRDSSEYAEIFEFMEKTLKRMSEYSKFYEKTKNMEFKGTFLPAMYNRYGYTLSTKNNLDKVEPSMKSTVLESSFLASFVNMFYKYMLGDPSSPASRMYFSKRLMYMYVNHIELGVAGVSSEVQPIVLDGDKGNKGIYNLQKRIFSEDRILSRQVVELVFNTLETFKKEGLY